MHKEQNMKTKILSLVALIAVLVMALIMSSCGDDEGNAITEDNTAIGTCRIFEAESEGEYYLGRLAVLREFRGKNVGTHLLSAAEEYIRSKNGLAVRLHSQLQAKQFYEKCGYIAFGEIDFEEDCPHIWMKKFLK